MSEYEDFNSYLQQEHLVKQTTSKPTEIDKLKIEIERQKNIIKGLDNTIENLNEVLQQKENITKEVREKIEELAEDDGDFIGEIDHNRKQELLEILDKENK